MLKIKSGGISTAVFKTFLKEQIDEDRIRKSGKDYGLVTVQLDDLMPLELMLEDIPQGQLCDYIMASASFPAFKREIIGEKTFIDGAIYNNCPYKLLVDKGYDEVIVVRTYARGVFHKVKDTEKVKIIAPNEDLGNMLLFTPERGAVNINLGYYDGLRYAKNLRGVAYYIEPIDTNRVNAQFMSLPVEFILKTGAVLGIPEMPAKRMLFEKIIPHLSRYLKLGRDYDYIDFAIAILELMAAQRMIERFHIYDYDHLCEFFRPNFSNL